MSPVYTMDRKTGHISVKLYMLNMGIKKLLNFTRNPIETGIYSGFQHLSSWTSIGFN